MVAISVLGIMVLLLMTMADGAGRLWSQGERQNQYRMHSRAMLDYIGRDLRQATLAVNQAAMVSAAKNTLELVINPSMVPSDRNYQNPNNIFWQAPIATDDHSQGDMAEVGYFVRWSTGVNPHADLCRFFSNPSDGSGAPNPNYLIYDNPSWLSKDILETVAPVQRATDDSPGQYAGLFLENVLGLWVQAYDVNGNLLNSGTASSYDSSSPPVEGHPLPAYIQISIITLENAAAVRLSDSPDAVSTIQSLYSNNASDFLNKLLAEPNGNVSAAIKSGANMASLKVSLDNYR